MNDQTSLFVPEMDDLNRRLIDYNDDAVKTCDDEDLMKVVIGCMDLMRDSNNQVHDDSNLIKNYKFYN